MSEKVAKRPKLSPTSAKAVKAKIKAEINDIPQAVVAREVFPNATPASASVMLSRELKKVNVQEALEMALAEYDLTPHRLAGVVNEAMDASKTVILGNGDDAFADVVPDHSIRLKAAGMAAQWMGVGARGDGGGNNFTFINVANDDRSKFGL